MTPRILIVEDEPHVANFLNVTLARKGYDPETVGSGEEALRLLAEQEFSLVLLDVQLPGISGFEVCRQIRAQARTLHLPVVFLTSKKGALDMAEAHEAGSDVYLTKPILSARLLNVVGMFLSKDGALSRRSS